MGSKKYKGQICAYCALASATTEDHVFARTFIPVAGRADLPKVGACRPCNGSKSLLEHYLASVLPFGGKHADAAAMLNNEVPRRLARNQRLHRTLAAGRQTILVPTHSGQQAEAATAVPFDGMQLFSYLRMVTRGLMVHHWRVLLTTEFDAVAVLPNPQVVDIFDAQFGLNSACRADADLGNGAFVYFGVQSTDYPQMSLWRYSLYGGAAFSGTQGDPGLQASTFYAITGRKRFVAHWERGFSGQREAASE